MAIRIKHSELRGIIKEQLQRLLTEAEETAKFQNLTNVIENDIRSLAHDMGPDLLKASRLLSNFVRQWPVYANYLTKMLKADYGKLSDDEKDEYQKNILGKFTEIRNTTKGVKEEFTALKTRLQQSGREVDEALWAKNEKRFAGITAKIDKFVELYKDNVHWGKSEHDTSAQNSTIDQITALKAPSEKFQDMKEGVLSGASEINVLDLPDTLRNEETGLYIIILKLMKVWVYIETTDKSEYEGNEDYEEGQLENSYKSVKGSLQKFLTSCLAAYKQKGLSKEDLEKIDAGAKEMHTALSGYNKGLLASLTDTKEDPGTSATQPAISQTQPKSSLSPSEQ